MDLETFVVGIVTLIFSGVTIVVIMWYLGDMKQSQRVTNTKVDKIDRCQGKLIDTLVLTDKEFETNWNTVNRSDQGRNGNGTVK